MRDQLIEAKANLETQIRRIDKALKFFEEHPEMESLLGAYQTLMSSSGIGLPFPRSF